MQKLATRFFGDMYTADEEVTPSKVIQLVEPQVLPSMNDELCKPFVEKEISDALF
jgi:hypothetical protein